VELVVFAVFILVEFAGFKPNALIVLMEPAQRRAFIWGILVAAVPASSSNQRWSPSRCLKNSRGLAPRFGHETRPATTVWNRLSLTARCGLS
jgi:hypothetical protein